MPDNPESILTLDPSLLGGPVAHAPCSMGAQSVTDPALPAARATEDCGQPLGLPRREVTVLEGAPLVGARARSQ